MHAEIERLRHALSGIADRRVILFGGKGGVGKTTLASLAALLYAERKPVVLFSTDPASNLGDLFDEPVKNIELVQLDAEDLYRRFLDENLEKLLELADRGTYLDREEVRRFFELALPGIDELMSWLEIDRLATERVDATIVVDTAPTGHTLRMLSAGVHFEQMTTALESMQSKHRELVEQLTRRRFRDEIDNFLERFRQRTDRVRDRLADGSQSAFIPVFLAERWVEAQTSDLLRELREQRIEPPFAILNHSSAGCDCERCRARVQAEKSASVGVEIVFAPDACGPIDSVDRMRRYLNGEDLAPDPEGGGEIAARELLIPDEIRLLFFAGKGGVGKTSSAISTALQTAASNPGGKFVLLSVDPAETLSEAFRDQQIPANLQIETIDTRAQWSKLRSSLEREIHEAVAALTPRGLSVAHDEEIVTQLIDIGPPGADEIFAVMRLADLIADESIDRIFVDTAPTGHFLRLIELPHTGAEWVKEFMRLLLRYKELIPPGSLAEKLVEASRSLAVLRQTLASETASVVLVTRPERIVVVETLRLRDELKKREIRVAGVVANQITPVADNTCRCDRRRAELEARSLQPLGGVVPVERRPSPPVALDDLRTLLPLRQTR